MYSWPLTANYHEYAYGPVFLPDGDMIVTLNVGWEGRGVSKAPFRGWLLRVSTDGKMTPIATGMRSPAGFGLNAAGDIFYAENQGDWVGSGRITHLESGDFAGHPAGLAWSSDKLSPLSLTEEEVTDEFGTMYEAASSNWRCESGTKPNEFGTMYEAGRHIEELKLPAVWFPHGVMGISTSDILLIEDDHFGPFAGQLLVGDQGQSIVMRMFLEEVEGEYQGACFPFREGFGSGILRLRWAPDGSLIAGMTSRGWAATGAAPFGLDRLTWSGEVPFEMQSIRAQKDGFDITFTQPVDPRSAQNPRNYAIQSFTYRYHHNYGSPAIDIAECPIESIELSEDGLTAHIKVKNLRLGYVHEVRVEGIRSQEANLPVLHPFGFYTLNALPGGGDPDYMGESKVVAVSPVLNTPKHVTELPEDWGGRVDQRVEIRTVPGLKYNTEEFRVKAGSHIALTLVNPDDMQHNLVITRPGQGQQVGATAIELGLRGPGQHYIPPSDQILYHTRLLEPSTEETIYFAAPSQPGRYDFVCTVPGHAAVMRGVMVVE